MIFRLEYKNREGLQARLDITTPGSSVIKEIEGTEQPFLLSYKGDKNDKSLNFLTSSAEINIYETPEFNIDTLKTSNETEIKVNYYIAGSLYWTGFVIPDFFSREIGGAGVVSMVASDRISTLKGVTLSDLPSMVSIRDLAIQCLEKTGLDLPLKTIADFQHGSTVNGFFTSEVASQRLTDNKGRSISCYDVLKSILVASNSRLEQSGGEWRITNKLQHELGTGKVYSSNSAFTNYIESVFNFSEITKGAMRSIVPVAGSVGIYHEHGGSRMHPKNFDFSLGGDGLQGWTEFNGFNAFTDNRDVYMYLGGAPFYNDDVLTKRYLVNYNNRPTVATNLDTAPYLESEAIPVVSNEENRVNVSIDISALLPEKGLSSDKPSFVAYAVIATNGVDTYALTRNGVFEPYTGDKDQSLSINLGAWDSPLILAAAAVTKNRITTGELEADNVQDYTVKVRIYGSGSYQYTHINYASISFSDATEIPKGVIYKREQGANYTKLHDTETSIIGDYITRGLDGYFYDYPIDDTSSLFTGDGELTSLWTTPFIANETNEYPLLRHVVTQKGRMFSVAHDLISGEIDMERFNPLSIFVDCDDNRYVVVSAEFDFLRSVVKVDLEEIAYANLTVRDFIYSYFGDGGEKGITSIGGISGGGGTSGWTSGGGITADEKYMIEEAFEKMHTHANKDVLDEIADIVKSTDEKTATDSNIPTTKAVEEMIEDKTDTLDAKYLSKTQPDRTDHHIEFAGGLTTTEANIDKANLFQSFIKDYLQFGESFVGGVAGTGGRIRSDGSAELKSLILREFLEVPELRYNRVDIKVGDSWSANGAGIFGSVDTVNQIITLKLEDGEVGTFRFDDICMGIYHSFDSNENSADDYDDGRGNRRFAGFATAYFRVTQILDTQNYSKFRYELRAGTSIHPKRFMTAVAYGNFSVTDRQASSYQTKTYTRYLRGVNNWEFTAYNVAAQFGDLSNLNIFGLNMQGYSAYLNNVYFSGIIHQLSQQIKDEIEKSKVGGKNLLREYDLRFNGAYWGNSNYADFDLSVIENTPQLFVSPQSILFAYPNRFITLVINATTAWTLTKPSWLTSERMSGVGNSNTAITADNYFGRESRNGNITVQSGIIQRAVNVEQEGKPEYVIIDPVFSISYLAQEITITGESNSKKLTFSADTGYLNIEIPSTYKVNGVTTNNGANIANDVGASDRYTFEIKINVGINVEDFRIENNLIVTADGGQKAMSTIYQAKTAQTWFVLGDENGIPLFIDGYLIDIKETI